MLSDRDSDAELAPIPSLLLTSAVHHHLIREKTRTQVGPRGRGGRRPRGAPHGAAHRLRRRRDQPVPRVRVDRGPHRAGPATASAAWTRKVAVKNYIKAAGKGVLKVMSKMGISTVASYRGAQVFEAIGLGQELVDEYFTGTVSRLGGIGLDEIAEEVATPPRARVRRPARRARAPRPRPRRRVPVAPRGRVPPLQPRDRVQAAARDPRQALRRLQGVHDARRRPVDAARDAARPVRARARACARRCRSTRSSRSREIVKRFATGAMSYGSISKEAHENLAIAMNRIGGKSNTGEGGEDADRYVRDANGDLRRSAIKQVASGRFGVTSEYLVNADDLQIKMAQGAKPGEGGQLPGPQGVPVDRQDPALHARASASSARRRTTTSTPSRTSSSSSTTSRTPTRRRACT